MSRHRNTLLRMKNVCEIAARYYEPGRADRCYKEVWRRYVYPVYPCCYRTFLNYIGVPVDAELKNSLPVKCHYLSDTDVLLYSAVSVVVVTSFLLRLRRTSENTSYIPANSLP